MPRDGSGASCDNVHLMPYPVRVFGDDALDSQVDLLKAFTPFEAELWIALLLALSLTVFLLWLYEGAKNDQFSRGSWSKQRRSITGVSGAR